MCSRNYSPSKPKLAKFPMFSPSPLLGADVAKMCVKIELHTLHHHCIIDHTITQRHHRNVIVRTLEHSGEKKLMELSSFHAWFPGAHAPVDSLVLPNCGPLSMPLNVCRFAVAPILRYGHVCHICYKTICDQGAQALALIFLFILEEQTKKRARFSDRQWHEPGTSMIRGGTPPKWNVGVIPTGKRWLLPR